MRFAYQFFLSASAIAFALTSCNGQTATDQQTEQELFASNQSTARVGGPCETCELIYLGMPENINAIDTSAAWDDDGKQLIVTGTVYRKDEKIPAHDIILYYWQTDNKGVYADRKGLDPAARRHGYIRGWVKTDEQGQYTIHTIRPGSYPNSSNPAHIHLLIKEPDIPNEYYIDDILFEDDPLLTNQIKKGLNNKGGPGVAKVNSENGIQIVKRDIILGQNIINYPNRQ